MDFKASQYQEDIFEFVKYGHGNVVISAMAGSGKSSTIIKALDYIKPERRVLFLAFNSSIVEELKKKISRDKTDIKTLHSLGFSMIKQNFKEKDIQISENKYERRLFDMLEERGIDFAPSRNYTKNILKLCNLGRFYLIKTKQELLTIANKYNVVLTSDELERTLDLIDWGKYSLNESNIIDYTDMVYLPNILNLKAFKYDFVIIDEAQDLSVSQMELFMKCFKQGSRFIAVGDKNQAIYSFSGADIESFNKLKSLPNTIQLPLSICYRCPKNVIRLAQKLVPEIESAKTAPEGLIKYEVNIKDLIDGDMVLCRNTLPLTKLYLELIDNNITSYIKGVDIGINLLELLDYSDNDNISNLSNYLDNSLAQYIKKNIEETTKSESEIMGTQEYSDFSDKTECLKILSKNITSKVQLTEKITNMFSDDNKQGVCLSTIHKAKGLEADNVYILNRKLMPSKLAKQQWELQQEFNLEYVAYTRPRKVLGFINN